MCALYVHTHTQTHSRDSLGNLFAEMNVCRYRSDNFCDFAQGQPHTVSIVNRANVPMLSSAETKRRQNFGCASAGALHENGKQHITSGVELNEIIFMEYSYSSIMIKSFLLFLRNVARVSAKYIQNILKIMNRAE